MARDPDNWLGIDFGTCYSSAARVRGGRAIPVKEPYGGFSVPSSVLLEDDGTLAVGVVAENRALSRPAHHASEFKRRLGQPEPVVLGERRYDVVDLVAAVLAFLREQAESSAGVGIDSAVITVPVAYGEERRDLVRQAGSKAGFARVELLQEPEAALIEHAAGKGARLARGESAETGSLVLVYDLGGGTFDAALVEVEGDRPVQVLGSSGIDSGVGGSDIDAAIIGDLIESAGSALEDILDEAESEDRALRERAMQAELLMLDFCERIKRDLSQVENSPPMLFLVPGFSFDYGLSRERLQELVDPMLERTLDCCRRLVEDCDRSLADVDGVLMVGGSCRLPLIEQTLRAELGRPVWHVEDPELAVCAGAALHAMTLETSEKAVVVDPAGDGDYTTISDALAGAGSGAVVTVRPGTYAEPLTWTEGVDVTLRGDGPRDRIVFDGGDEPALTVREGATASLEAVTLRSNERAQAAVVVSRSTLRMEGCGLEGGSLAVVGVRGEGATAHLRGNRVSGGADAGIVVTNGASVVAEYNDVFENAGQGIRVSGAGTSARLRNNDVEANGGVGLLVIGGADVVAEDNGFVSSGDPAGAPLPGAGVPGAATGAAAPAAAGGEREERFESGTDRPIPTEEPPQPAHHGGYLPGISDGPPPAAPAAAPFGGVAGGGIAISGADTRAVIRSNRIGPVFGPGIKVVKGARPLVESNQIKETRDDGIELRDAGTAPELRSNRITSVGGAGVLVGEGAAGVLEGNEITRGRTAGIRIAGAGAEPVVRANVLRANGGPGVDAEAGAGLVESNEITENASGVRVGPGAKPVVRTNTILANTGGAFPNGAGLATLDANVIWTRAMPEALYPLAAALVAGRRTDADEETVAVLAQYTMLPIADAAAANRIPDAVLMEIDRLWLEATGARLRTRQWASEGGRVTGVSFFDTHLVKRLKALGLR